MDSQERICKLCLKICNNFKVIVGDLKDVLDIVVPKIDLTTIEEPVMCRNCIDMVIKCFDFKTMCFYTHDYIVPFVNKKKNDFKLDLKDVYLSKNENVTDVPEDQGICGLCMDPIQNCSTVYIDIEEGGFMLKQMIEQCLPELDFDIIKKPVICPPCHGSLMYSFRFVKNCLIAEEKFKKYCEILGVNSRGQIDLKGLLQLTLRDLISEVDDNLVDIIKLEEQSCEEKENAEERGIAVGRDLYIRLERICVDSENADEKINHRNKSFIDRNGPEFNDQLQFSSKNISTCKKDSNRLDEKGNFDFNRCEDGVSSRPEAIASLHSRQKCVLGNLEGDLSQSHIKHTSTRKDGKISSDNCDPPFKCNVCSYRTEYKCNLNSHSLVHKNPSEITMYECARCSFQTKRKFTLRKHSLRHRDPSEAKAYECYLCPFRTEDRTRLETHSPIHKDPLDPTMYRCDRCAYRTRNKYGLKRHLLLVHTDPSEVTSYRCGACSFQAKEEHALDRHLLKHKDPSEVIMYGCDPLNYI